MLEQVREAGAPLRIVASAHIEHWLLIIRDEGARPAVAYMKRPEVQQELQWAAAHSVLNPAFRLAPGWVTAHSSFAMAFSMADNYSAAAAHFNALLANGNLADEGPWRYVGEATDEFVSFRNLAFQKGSRR